jgi:hypothetical protein
MKGISARYLGHAEIPMIFKTHWVYTHSKVIFRVHTVCKYILKFKSIKPTFNAVINTTWEE